MLMKKMFLYLMAATIFTASLQSCRVTFIAGKDPQALVATENIQSAFTSLYDRIIVAPDKTYSAYQNDYADIRVQIDSLKAYDQRRPKAANITHQVAIFQEQFNLYEKEHRDKGKITAGEARVYKVYLNSFIKPIQISENSLK